MFMLYVWNQVSADINQLLFPHCQAVRGILNAVKTCSDSTNVFNCQPISSKRLLPYGSSSVGPPILQAVNFSNLPQYVMFRPKIWIHLSAGFNQLSFPYFQPVRGILDDVKTCSDSTNVCSCPLIFSKRTWPHGGIRTNHNSICDAVLNR